MSGAEASSIHPNGVCEIQFARMRVSGSRAVESILPAPSQQIPRMKGVRGASGTGARRWKGEWLG